GDGRADSRARGGRPRGLLDVVALQVAVTGAACDCQGRAREAGEHELRHVAVHLVQLLHAASSRGGRHVGLTSRSKSSVEIGWASQGPVTKPCDLADGGGQEGAMSGRRLLPAAWTGVPVLLPPPPPSSAGPAPALVLFGGTFSPTPAPAPLLDGVIVVG